MLPRVCKNKRLKKTALAFVFLALAVFLFLPIIKVSAQVVVPQTTAQKDVFGLQPVGQNIGLGNDDIRLIIARIIRAALGLLGVVAMALVIYAGFTIMTSEGNEEKMEQGKRILKNAVIGLVIILSAFSIASFIINSLAKATGINRGTATTPPKIATFGGSGALGRVVRDHYPFRDQKDVPRNTRVVVTFGLSIEPASLIINTNRTCWATDFSGPTTTCQTLDNQPVGVGTPLDQIKNPYYGDCLTDKADFKFETDCDSAVTSSFKFYESASSSNLINTAALTSYDKDHNAKSFVFIPYKYLGSDTDPVKYTVYLTNNIWQAGTREGVFANMFSQYYSWDFETGTGFDFEPPYVVAVNPEEGAGAPRNRLLQIYFNEPVDPTVAEGYFNATDTAQFFSNIIINTSSSLPIAGNWVMGNGYKSVEFISDFPCGRNSCGQVRFCLPVPASCSPTDVNCSEGYEVLAKTADLLVPGNNKSFVAKPFTGLYDVNGNALNGNQLAEKDNLVANGQPKETNGQPKLITIQNKKSDNFWWGFDIMNSIDKEAPYISKITPDIEADKVVGDVPLNLTFSKLLSQRGVNSSNVKLSEYWGQTADDDQFCFANNKCLDELWFVPYPNLLSEAGERHTLINIKHREFGPNDTDFFYFPQIFSALTDENQNCFYPGRGPEKGKTCRIVYNQETGLPTTITDCVEMQNTSSTADTACVTQTSVDKLQPDVNTCVSKIKTKSTGATASK